jgi:hypothetical protein
MLRMIDEVNSAVSPANPQTPVRSPASLPG